MAEHPLDQAIRDVVYDVLGIDNPASTFIAERLRDVLLRVDQVSRLTGLSRASLYREIKAGRFPKPFKATDHVSVWRLTEIESWIAELKRAA